MKFEFSQQIFEKYSNFKFHENPSSGSEAVPCGRTGGERQTDVTKLRVAFPNLANEHKNKIIQYILHTDTRSDSGSIHAKKTKKTNYLKQQ